MVVPVAMPHMAASLTHHRYLEERTDSRIPKASGKKRVHLAVSIWSAAVKAFRDGSAYRESPDMAADKGSYGRYLSLDIAK
jgi:predicted P-loop ATPase